MLPLRKPTVREALCFPSTMLLLSCSAVTTRVPVRGRPGRRREPPDRGAGIAEAEALSDTDARIFASAAVGLAATLAMLLICIMQACTDVPVPTTVVMIPGVSVSIVMIQ
jgi:hypothetical protein